MKTQIRYLQTTTYRSENNRISNRIINFDNIGQPGIYIEIGTNGGAKLHIGINRATNIKRYRLNKKLKTFFITDSNQQLNCCDL